MKRRNMRKERRERKKKGKRNEQMLNLTPLLLEQHFNE
jgi:hypothetical protein